MTLKWSKRLDPISSAKNINLKRNEYKEDTEAYRHGNEEVAGDNSACVVLDERRPTLILAAMRSWRLPDVFSNRAWREPNLELEPKFIGNPLFAPGQIFGCHSTN